MVVRCNRLKKKKKKNSQSKVPVYGGYVYLILDQDFLFPLNKYSTVAAGFGSG